MTMPNQRTREEQLADLVRNMKYLYDHEYRPHTSNEMGWHHDMCAIQLTLLCQYREIAPVDFRSAEVGAIIEEEVRSFRGYIERAKSDSQRQRFGCLLTVWQEASMWLPAMGDVLIKAFQVWGRPPFGERWTTSPE